MQTTENQREKLETIPVATRITEPMQRAVQEILEVNSHINLADYLRDLIRRDLEKRGLCNQNKKEVKCKGENI